MTDKGCTSMTGCHACPLTRRRFLAGCAAGAVGLGPLGGGLAKAAPQAKPRVRLVFTVVPSNRPIWPNIGYDFEKRKKELTRMLAKACGGVEFLPATVMNAAQARKLLADDKNVDGYLVYMLGLWTGAPQVIGASGKGALFVDDLYGGSGEFLIAYAAARRKGHKVAPVSSSRFEDVAEAARCFELLKKPGGSTDAFLAACERARKKSTQPAGEMKCIADAVKTISPEECLAKLRGQKILTVGGGWGMPRSGNAIKASFGVSVIPIGFKELHAAYTKADRAEATQWAEKWIKAAEKVVEPRRQEIDKSAAMYLGMRELLKRHNAQAITINCLGGFYGRHIQAFPCLGFCQLNDDGMVGACESDIYSTITMLVFGGLTGRPGFISDPVIDTSKNQVIYAHCVAPTKVFGPGGTRNAYHIRNHSEDRRGASMRSLLPLGYMTTTLEIRAERKEMLIHQGKSVDNIDEDKACRTKLAAEVKGDIDKLLSEWDVWRWHRVTFYGDIKVPVQELAKKLKFRLIEEA